MRWQWATHARHPRRTELRELQSPRARFQRPNFLHEDLRISDLMLRARHRTLFFSNLLDVRAYQSRGVAYAASGQNRRAVQDYDEAIRLDPELARAYRSRAKSYNVLGEDEQARHDVDRAVVAEH